MCPELPHRFTEYLLIDPIALNDQIVHLQRRLLRLAAEHASPLARVG